MLRSAKPEGRHLVQAADEVAFSPAELVGLDEPVRRYFTAAIAEGTPLARTARFRMRGRIRLGGWVPFHAHQVLTPHQGMVWSGRAGGVITGFDRYLDGRGLADWKILGRVAVMHAEGRDVDRSAAGRCGAEAIWVPTALLPRFGVAWSTIDDHLVTARYDLDGVPIELHLELDDLGRVRACVFDRWGDPDETGTARWVPFGGDITGSSEFGGVSIPGEGRFGWFHGTDRWSEGEFFRFHITHHGLVS